MNQLNNPLLKRYWFKTKENFGLGVTACSLADANYLIEKANLSIDYQILEVIEDIDIQTLGQNHVIPNMGNSKF